MSEDEITAKLHTDELAAAHEEIEKRAPGVVQRIRIGARTDLGRVRENNEDKFDYLEPEDPIVLANNGSLYAVADGMGGHAAGQIASELALKTLIKSYYSTTSPDVETQLRNSIAEANRIVYDTARMIPDRAGMGTTVVVAVVRADDLFIAHAGDSRAYLLRNGMITRLTRDHSWIAEQVDAGILSEKEAENSPYRNIITRSLGNSPSVDPDIKSLKTADGDRVLLCSDGLTGMLPDTEIFHLGSNGSPSEAALSLVDAANERGGNDNITVLIIQIEETGRTSPQESVVEEASGADESCKDSWVLRLLRRR